MSMVEMKVVGGKRTYRNRSVREKLINDIAKMDSSSIQQNIYRYAEIPFRRQRDALMFELYTEELQRREAK
tara:strand:+ start:864 stop:1076 length:213 start_codon:yes stop_codon:yes gene_type:complete